MSAHAQARRNAGNYMYYRDYVGNVEFSEADAVFHGKVIGIKALLSFEGDNVRSLTEDFHSAVDEYLAACAERGATPEKPYKGTFNVRVGVDLHRKAALTAAERGITLNAFVEDALRQAVSV